METRVSEGKLKILCCAVMAVFIVVSLFISHPASAFNVINESSHFDFYYVIEYQQHGSSHWYPGWFGACIGNGQHKSGINWKDIGKKNIKVTACFPAQGNISEPGSGDTFELTCIVPQCFQPTRTDKECPPNASVRLKEENMKCKNPAYSGCHNKVVISCE